MNRLFVISVGSLEIKGLISPGELPDVVINFYRMSENRGASPDYLGDGVFVAVKQEVRLTLTVGDYHDPMPSRLLVEVLEEIMEQVFK